MPRHYDAPSMVVRADIKSLQRYMSAVMPSKRLVENLPIATWSIRGFASLKRKRIVACSDPPKRDLRGISRLSTAPLTKLKPFEVRNPAPYLRLLSAVGLAWIVTPSVRGDALRPLTLRYDTRASLPTWNGYAAYRLRHTFDDS